MSNRKNIIADDHAMFRDALKMLIDNEEIGTVVAEVANGKELLETLKVHQPDLVLMDISMPEMNGIEAGRKAIELYPNLKILALSMFGDEEYYYKMIDAGVKGFVLKSSGMHELEEAITKIASGENYFSNELLRRIIMNLGKRPKEMQNFDTPPAELTPREQEVLSLICAGKTNDEIGEQLFISPTTVKGHRRNLLSKTGCNNTASLVMYAIKHQIITI